MTVTTSKHHAQNRRSTAKSLSDLEALLKKTTPVYSTTESQTQPQESETTMNTQATQSQAQAQATAEAAADVLNAIRGGQKNTDAPAGEDPEAMLAALQEMFTQAISSMSEDTKKAVEGIGEHIKTAVEPLAKQINQCVEDTAAVKKDVDGLRADLESLKKTAAANGAAEPAKEQSKLLKTAAIVKDIGAYSGAAVLVAVVGKTAYDLFKGKSEE